MQMRGTWLAALAIALHAFWPLIANARPESVNLVPVCTVDGVTHYAEIPGGKSPLDESSSAHHEHCSFCFLGERLALPNHFEFTPMPRQASAGAVQGEHWAFVAHGLITAAARAPPGSPLVHKTNLTTTENHETASAVGRHRDGAVAARSRKSLVRVGVLHR